MESKATELYNAVLSNFKLDKEQLMCIESNEEKVCVYGGAGTGKSLVVLAKALRLLAENPEQKVAIVAKINTTLNMFNWMLNRFAVQCGEKDDYHATAGKLEVMTLHQMTRAATRYRGYNSDSDLDYDCDKTVDMINWSETKKMWSDEGLVVDENLHQYDHILLDEAVDCRPSHFEMLIDMLRSGGSLTIMVDKVQQLNYGGPDIPNFREEGYAEYALTRVYRSTDRIVNYAKRINFKANNIVNQFKDNREDITIPIPLSCTSRKEELAKIKERVGLGDSKLCIGIVARTNADVAEIEKELADLVTEPFVMNKPGVYVMNVTNAKGLEFDEVIIPFVESYGKNFTSYYVAVTRARFNLVLVYDETSPSLNRKFV